MNNPNTFHWFVIYLSDWNFLCLQSVWQTRIWEQKVNSLETSHKYPKHTIIFSHLTDSNRTLSAVLSTNLPFNRPYRKAMHLKYRDSMQTSQDLFHLLFINKPLSCNFNCYIIVLPSLSWEEEI